MAEAIISYDKDLPEIPDREPHLPPTAHLRKKPDKKDAFEIVEGRRPSKLLLIKKLRDVVEQWRKDDYAGASHVTQRLFTFWFDEDHLVGGKPFRYYFGQREAVETLIYLYEILKNKDAKSMVDSFGEIFYPEGTQLRLTGMGITHQTTMDGKSQIRRYIPEVESETVQDLPAQDLRRYAFKMATGSGKTVVMAMVMVWSYFHRKMVSGSDLSKNFLLIAPNVIVYQRLEKDFSNNQIFNELPLIAPEWKSQWNVKVILRGQSTEPDPSGNLFLTNIQQIYEGRQTEWTASSAIDALLGKKPVKDLASYERPMLERLQTLRDLVVFNDEAHHVHDEELEWHKTLMGLHQTLPSGLALWLDFSATPKDQNGTYFPWIICDYPLAQAVEDRIVKAPLIVHQIKKEDPDQVTRKNVIEAYGDWLLAAITRWKEHYDTYKDFGQRPVLFIMAEQNNLADEIGEWLIATKETGLKKSEVLVIHTDKEGEISKKDLEAAREGARDIDKPKNKIKVIVSVLMLREGWDVRNVSVVLGLRPFTSKAKILPEQAVGRGLRLMFGISPDKTQTLEVMGTSAFEGFVRQLETEGVGIRTVTTPPKPPVKVEPVAEKSEFDIAIPMTKPVYSRNYRKLADLDIQTLAPLYDLENIDERIINKIKLVMEYATTQTEVHQADIALGPPPLAQDIIASVTNRVIRNAKLTGVFDELYLKVRDYLNYRCFAQEVDLEINDIREILREIILQEEIARYLGGKIGELTAEVRPIEFESKDIRLSETSPFTWRRNLPLITCDKTIFNLVATYNDFEKSFGRFLEKATDVLRFASLGTTEQESGTPFRVDYLKPSGATGFYYPDWVAVQQSKKAEINWIIETKGRVWEGTKAKDQAISLWCKRVAEQTGKPWRYLRVNQSEFQPGAWSTLGQLFQAIIKG